MGEIRSFGYHKRWTNDEVIILSATYNVSPRGVLVASLPGRTVRQIECKANGLGLQKAKKSKRTRHDYLAAKRDGMARLRARNPEEARRKRNEFHARNREQQKRRMREYASRRFFWNRANKLRGDNAATYKDLARLWKLQRGLCALTGRKMDRSAEPDHKLAKARGGTDDIGNMQWICRDVNRAKRDMTDAEFIEMCGNVMRWVGQKIDLADNFPVRP